MDPSLIFASLRMVLLFAQEVEKDHKRRVRMAISEPGSKQLIRYTSRLFDSTFNYEWEIFVRSHLYVMPRDEARGLPPLIGPTGELTPLEAHAWYAHFSARSAVTEPWPDAHYRAELLVDMHFPFYRDCAGLSRWWGW